MKAILFFSALVVSIAMDVAAQSVGIGTATPNSSAILDVSSTTQGMLLPRMTTAQRNAIVNPAQGLMIFNTDDHCTDVFDGINWIRNCGYKQTGSVEVVPESWVQKADFGSPFGVRLAVGFSIGSKGYIGTGLDQVSSTYKKDFWEYDTATNAWTQKADFGGTGRINAVGFAIGSKGYIGTGVLNGSVLVKDFWEYDPSLNNWIQKADFGGTVRQDAVGFSIGSKGYIGTGIDPSDFRNDFWEYDPGTNTWTQKANLAGVKRSGAAGFSILNKGYIGTGYGPGFSYLRDFWEYDPGTNSWTQNADFGVIGRTDAVGFSIGNKGYIGTGFENSSTPADFWEYDIVSNNWTQKNNFTNLERTSAVGFSIGNKGYLGTGYIGGLPRKDFWAYTQEQYVPAYSTSPFGSAQVQVSDGVWTKTLNSITTNYNVGIGMTPSSQPATRLDIAGANNWDLTNTEGDFRIGNGTYRIKMGIALGGGGAGAANIRSAGGIERLNLGAGNTTLLTLNGASGNVGIGTEGPSQKLHVVGNILATGTITPSDVRYKEDIQRISDPVTTLMQLNGVTYHYRYKEFTDMGFTSQDQVGIIAQDVEKVLPQLVFTDDKGYKSVDYTKLVPLLIEGLKAQQKQIDQQQQQIDELKDVKEKDIKMEDLQKQIDEQKKMIEQFLKK